MLGDIHEAAGRLRNAWPALCEAVNPSNTRRTTTRLSARQIDAQADLHRKEQSDWIEAVKRGDSKPQGQSPAPVNISAIDTAAAVETTVLEVADELYRASHANGLALPGDQDARVLGALHEIVTHAGGAHPDLWPAAARRLESAAALAERAAGWVSLPMPLYGNPTCPCCGDHALTALVDVASDHRLWTVTCGSKRCRCRGIDCDCGRAGRTPGARHVWTVSEWQRLAEQINAA